MHTRKILLNTRLFWSSKTSQQHLNRQISTGLKDPKDNQCRTLMKVNTISTFPFFHSRAKFSSTTTTPSSALSKNSNTVAYSPMLSTALMGLSTVFMGLLSMVIYELYQDYKKRSIASDKCKKSEDLIDQGQLHEALILLLQSYEIREENRSALTSLAKVESELGLYSNALDHVRKAMILHDNKEEDDDTAEYILAKIYLESGDLNKAYLYCKRVIKTIEKHELSDNEKIESQVKAYSLLGYIELLKYEFSNSCESFVKADKYLKMLEADKNASDDYSRLESEYSLYKAFLLRELREYEEADELLDITINYYKNNGFDRHPNLATAYYMKGLITRDKVETYPIATDMTLAERDISFEHNETKLKSAENYLNLAIGIDEKIFHCPHPNTAVKINVLGLIFRSFANAYAKKGDETKKRVFLQKSLACFKRALEMDIGCFGAANVNHNRTLMYLNLGRSLRENGHEEEALEVLEKVANICEQFYVRKKDNKVTGFAMAAVIYTNIGCIYLEKMRNKEVALYYFKKVLNMNIEALTALNTEISDDRKKTFSKYQERIRSDNEKLKEKINVVESEERSFCCVM